MLFINKNLDSCNICKIIAYKLLFRFWQPEVYKYSKLHNTQQYNFLRIILLGDVLWVVDHLRCFFFFFFLSFQAVHTETYAIEDKMKRKINYIENENKKIFLINSTWRKKNLFRNKYIIVLHVKLKLNVTAVLTIKRTPRPYF